MKLLVNVLVSLAITLFLIGAWGLLGPWQGASYGLAKAIKPFLKYKPDLDP